MSEEKKQTEQNGVFPLLQQELLGVSRETEILSPCSRKIFPINGKEKVLFSRDPDLPGMEFRFSRYDGFKFARHTHDTYTVGVVLEGASYCTDKVADSSLVASGDVFHINPEQVHSGVPLRDVGVSYLLFYADPKWVRNTVYQISEIDHGFPEFKSFCSNSLAVSEKFKAFYRCLSLSGTSLAKQSLAVSAFAELFSGNGRIVPVRTGNNEHRAVAVAKEYLESNVGRKVSLDELAAVTGLSSYYFLRVFKKSTGMTPHAFFIIRRIEKARKMILSGLPFSEIALECGFGDQSHFTHKFKQFMGVTPGQYAGTV
jgi:AraC-like DNA-binding protein